MGRSCAASAGPDGVELRGDRWPDGPELRGDLWPQWGRSRAASAGPDGGGADGPELRGDRWPRWGGDDGPEPLTLSCDTRHAIFDVLQGDSEHPRRARRQKSSELSKKLRIERARSMKRRLRRRLYRAPRATCKTDLQVQGDRAANSLLGVYNNKPVLSISAS